MIGKGTEGSKVKNILARENYYSIINGYKDVFLDAEITDRTGEDYYVTGTTFFHIYSVYCFDRNLRSILMKGLLQAEQNLCTKVSYRFAEDNKSEFSHLNINNFSKADLPTTTRLISTLSSVTQRNSKDKDSGFYHYLTHHQDLPLWVLVTKLTFGEITYFYKSMVPPLQERVLNDINKDYTSEFGAPIAQPTSSLISKFNEILDVLVAFRNICAHGDRLYNHRVRIGKNTRKLLYYFMSSPKGSEASFYGALISLRLFLVRPEYKRLIKSVMAELLLLRKSIPEEQFNKLLGKMELTLNWQDSLDKLK
jgi:abi-like protein